MIILQGYELRPWNLRPCDVERLVRGSDRKHARTALVHFAAYYRAAGYEDEDNQLSVLGLSWHSFDAHDA